MQMTSPLDPRTPVIVGVGQVVQRPADGESLDPIALSLEALRRAGADSGTGDALLRRADSIRQVATSGWLYKDEPALIAAALGADPRERVRTNAFGGDGPGRLVGDSARSIAAGEADVVLIAGAEALATLSAHARAGTRPDWPEQSEGAPTRVIGVDRAPVNDAESAVGLLAPLNVYALLETAVRAARGLDRDEHLANIAALWSRFSAVAAENPYAWLPREHTPEEIASPIAGNRIVSEPYTKLLVANIQVDQAAALIMCSAQAAQDAGVPRDRWVFPLAVAFAHDEWFVTERASLASSPAIRACGQAVLGHAGISIDDVAHIDLYSCFPSAVQIAAAELGLPIFDPRRPLTLTGGLTFGGGPGNNYGTHGIATLVARLREDPAAIGLASALGWYCTKHAYGLYSATAPDTPFAEIDADTLIERPAARTASSTYAGPAMLESYTVPYGRDGSPEAVVATAIAADGTRAVIRSDNREAIAEILETDPRGETVTVSPGSITVAGGVVAG